MKTILFLLIGFTAFQANKPSPLAFLPGSWQAKVDKSSMYYEHWRADKLTGFHGKAYLVSGKDTTERETMRIMQTHAGFVYRVSVNAAPAVSFFSKGINSEGEWVFENKAHDFPQRIVYKSSGENKLYARIEGTSHGELQRVEFDFTRRLATAQKAASAR